MTSPHPQDHLHPHQHEGGRSRWIFIGFAVAAGVLLFSEHRAHLLGFLPYLLLLACPLMHFFHHHGGHRHPHPGRESHSKTTGSNEEKP